MSEPIVFNGVEIAAVCDNCQGSGQVRRESDGPPPMRDCYICDGEGIRPTEDGLVMLAFVRRFLKIKTELRII